MKHSILKCAIYIFAAALLLVLAFSSGNTASAKSLAQEVTPEPEGFNSSGSSSQGGEAALLPPPSTPLDDLTQFGDAASASFYHIPGSVLVPVSSTTTLSYDLMGCVHATANGSALLNAPLDIPPGSNVVLIRMYYDDTNASTDVNGWITAYNEAGTNYSDLVSVSSSGSAGHGNNYGNLDIVTNTYDNSYVINARLNGASSTLQICGFRVMYYAPVTYGAFLPNAMKNAQ